MNRGTPHPGSAVETHDQTKKNPEHERSKRCYTHCTREQEEQPPSWQRTENTEKISSKQKAKGSGRLLGEARPRGGQEEALRGMQIRGVAAVAGIRRDSGGTLDLARGSDRRGGVGAGVGGVRRLPSTLPFQPASHRCLRSRVGRCRAGLDWTGLPPPHCPLPAFPLLRTSPPFCSRGLFPLESRPPLLARNYLRALAPSQSA